MFSCVTLERMDRQFDALYAKTGRPSIAPEKLIRARQLVSQEHFTVNGTLIQAWASRRSFRAKSDPRQDGVQRDCDLTTSEDISNRRFAIFTICKITLMQESALRASRSGRYRGSGSRIGAC